MQNTIINLLHNGAADAPAIVAPDTEPLNYATFKLHVTKVVAALKSFGVGRGDRVAIVLPNGRGKIESRKTGCKSALKIDA